MRGHAGISLYPWVSTSKTSAQANYFKDKKFNLLNDQRKQYIHGRIEYLKNDESRVSVNVIVIPVKIY